MQPHLRIDAKLFVKNCKVKVAVSTSETLWVLRYFPDTEWLYEASQTLPNLLDFKVVNPNHEVSVTILLRLLTIHILSQFDILNIHLFALFLMLNTVEEGGNASKGTKHPKEVRQLDFQPCVGALFMPHHALQSILLLIILLIQMVFDVLNVLHVLLMETKPPVYQGISFL